jgi:HK97 family phage portal protein
MLLSSGVYRPLAPQAFAETAPQFHEAYFAPRTGIELATKVATYGLMYRVQPHLFSAIDKVANLMAKLSVGVYDTSPESGDKLDRVGPYAQLMKNPCVTLPRFKFYHWLSTTYETYGEAYLLKNRSPATGRITSFLPLHPAVTYVHRGDDGYLYYGFTGAPDKWFPESEVVPFRRYNPDNYMRGLSRMEPLRQTLMNEDSARRAIKSWWDNMGRPSYILSTSKKLGTKGREHLEKGVQSAIGGADNAGGVMVLEDEVTATRMQLDAEEMQYIESRKLNRTECFEVYDLNPAVAQINENTTSTSYEPMTKDVYKSSIDHRLRDFESTFDFYVGTEFNGPKEFRFEVNQHLRADIEMLAPAIVQLVQSFVLQPAEGRMWLGLDDAGPLAAKLYGNQALKVIDMAQVPKDPEPQPGSPPIGGSTSNNSNPNPNGDLPQRVPALSDKAKRYKNQILSGLGRGTTWDEIGRKMLERNPVDREDIQRACLDILMEQ